MRKLFTLITCLAFGLWANAQVWKVSPAPVNLPHVLKAGKLKTLEKPAKGKGQIQFGYAPSSWNGNSIGIGKAETYYAAIKVPAAYAGMKVKTFVVPVYDKSVVKDVKAFASASLPATSAAADFHVDVADVKDVSTDQALNEVDMNNYTIPANGCYLGYEFTVTDVSTQGGQFPLVVNGAAAEGTSYIKTSNTVTNWTDVSGTNVAYNLYCFALIEGDFPDNAVSFVDGYPIDGTVSQEAEGTTVRLPLQNKGSNKLASLTYTLKDNGSGAEKENTVELTGNNQLALMDAAYLPITVAPASKAMRNSYTVTITKVNGQPNEATTGVSLSGVTTVAKKVEKKVVEEEFTTTDCGWCPRGMTGMRMLQEKYPDSYIGIAAHGSGIGNWNDPMYLTGYASVLNSVGGFPSAMIDRSGVVIDPYYGSQTATTTPFGIEQDFKEALEQVPEMSVKVSPVWADENQTQIKATTDMTFQLNDANSSYGVAYVLVADGLQGTTQSWWQINYFRTPQISQQFASDTNLAEWFDRGEAIGSSSSGTTIYAVKDMTYNHVAVAAYNVYSGINNSVPASVEAGQEVKHTYTINVGTNKLIQDKTKLKLVAMVVDKKTHAILNADEAEIAPYSTGIEGVGADAEVKEVARYTVDGRKVDAPVKGVNIVKLSNGKTLKVVVE